MKLFVLAFKNQRLLINLIKSDFKNRYLGNHFGIVWAFIQPLVMLGVYWFVFVHGFRATPINNIPFILWLMAGLVPWLLLSDGIVSASGAVVSQSFLVKQIVFEVKLLPIIKIGSSLLVNIAFWLLILIVGILYGYYPNLIWLQLFYYMFCILMISLSLSLLLSPLMPFMPDVGQVVSIFFQIMFWATPVMWNQSLLKGPLELVYELNPFAYIISGVRDTLLFRVPIWEHYYQMMYFWGFTFVIFWLGNRVFNKLRPHFADVL